MQISESAVARGVNADKQRSLEVKRMTDPTMFRVFFINKSSVLVEIGSYFEFLDTTWFYLLENRHILSQKGCMIWAKNLLQQDY